MFIAGLVLIVVSIVFVIAGGSAKKAGNVQGGSISLLGKAGIAAGIILLVASGIRIIGPGEVGVLINYYTRKIDGRCTYTTNWTGTMQLFAELMKMNKGMPRS